MAGDFMTLWEGLKRSVNMIPFGSKDISNICLVYFLLLEPFMLLPLSVYLVFIQSPENKNLSQILLTIDLMSIVLIISVIVIQLSINLSLSPFYAVFGPIACTIISIAFISSIVKSRRRDTIKWRGREYVITEKIYNTVPSKNN